MARRNGKSKNYRDDRTEETKDYKLKGRGKGYHVKDSYTSKENDASWYTQGAQLTLDAGRLSFNVPTGSKIDWGLSPDNFNNINGLSIDDYRLPGVCSLGFAPTYGVVGEANDPLNIAARHIYSYIRHANSGSANYDPNDLMLYLLGMDGVYMVYQHLCRIYGLARVYSQLNFHLPTTLFEAMNVDYDDVVAHLNDLRAYINTVCAKIGSLCVPSVMPLFQRHMWMCSGVYADAPSPKSQFYIFVPEYIPMYDESTSPRGGRIIPNGRLYTNTTEKFTVNYLCRTMDLILNAMIMSEDCGIISGDIRKAYGESGLMQISMIGDDYVVLPVYSEEVLRQIQNATIFQNIHYTDNTMVGQDVNKGILTSGLTCSSYSRFYSGNRILTGSDASPSPEEVLVNSRLCVHVNIDGADPMSSPTPSPTQPAQFLLRPTAVGSEIIVNCRVFRSPEDDPAFLAYAIHTNDIAQHELGKFMNAYSKLENFNYHPRVGVMLVSEQQQEEPYLTTKETIKTFADVDNYTVVDANVLRNLHLAAILSLFGVPNTYARY